MHDVESGILTINKYKSNNYLYTKFNIRRYGKLKITKTIDYQKYKAKIM